MELTLSVAWKMTFREIDIHRKGYERRKLFDYKERLNIAHTTAWLTRVDAKDFPKHAKELYPDRPKDSPEVARMKRLSVLDEFAGLSKPQKIKVPR